MPSLPPELTKWLDLPLAITTILIVRALTPWLSVSRWFQGDRIIGAVLIVGILLGCAVEATTTTFDPHMAIRRTGFTAGMAALMFKAAKAYLPWMKVGDA